MFLKKWKKKQVIVCSKPRSYIFKTSFWTTREFKSLYKKGLHKFIKMVSVIKPEWLPCPYVVKPLKWSSTEPEYLLSFNLKWSIGARGPQCLYKYWLLMKNLKAIKQLKLLPCSFKAHKSGERLQDHWFSGFGICLYKKKNQKISSSWKKCKS